MSQRFLQRELLAMLPGSKIHISNTFCEETNSTLRADARHALRQRLAHLSKKGKFRMSGDDEWERM